MKVSVTIRNESLGWKEVDGVLFCPHCLCCLQREYDSNELEIFGDNGIRVTKDPYFCECISETTIYWKCPKCGKPIEEFISWDN